jgi:hypothetical protein
VVRFVVLVALAASLAPAPGCAPRQEDVEKAVRREVSARLEAEVDSLKLEKQPGGGYAGTATIGGDAFDVVVDPPRGGRVQWRLFPSRATVERVVTDGLQARHQLRVTALDLKKQEGGSFTGTAALEDGTKLHVTAKLEGRKIVWETEPVL